MVQSGVSGLRTWFSSNRYQAVAFAFCFLFGAAIVMNVEMAGEASWFWYATLMHHGMKLYADMHLPLQPFYPLETDAWIQMVGRSTIAYETLALIHIFILCLGMLLLLRESPWPDWRKACIFAAAFFTDIFFLAIRFDDFHVVNDIFAIYSLIVLLRVYHAGRLRAELVWSAVAGILSGLSFMNRSTDGGTLLAAAAVCVPFLSRRRKLLSTAIFLVFAALSMAAIVRLTGDTFHAYLSNSILHAAAAKGGTGTVFRGPYLAVIDNVQRLIHVHRCLWFAVILVAGALARRYWKDTTRAVLTTELACAAAVMVGLAMLPIRRALWNGVFLASLNVVVQSIVYPLCVLVILRFLLARYGRTPREWDAREILVLVPAAELVSAAVSQANGTTNSTVSMALLVLLSTLWLPAAGRFRWLNDSWVSIALIVASAGMVYKIVTPYSWNAYAYAPMFEGRQWYRHPVYGEMYLQSDLLHFIQPICRDIKESGPHPQLLSLPYSYANYFCALPPWHGYVQTWFDTSTPQTIETLMQQLNDAPPQWILYERQISVLRAHEIEYNGGRPIIHRKLDELIMGKLADGQWKLVERDNYLKGDGWFLIETHP
jgi:hypothetical protein